MHETATHCLHLKPEHGENVLYEIWELIKEKKQMKHRINAIVSPVEKLSFSSQLH